MAFFDYLRQKILATLLRGAYMLAQVIIWRDIRLFEELDVRREHIQLPSREKGRYIRADLYYPSEYLTSPTDKARPILINWHGSGWVCYGWRYNAYYCAHIARETGMFVLDADYRKGPETTFPGPYNDVEDALRWVASQPGRFDQSRVVVSGFSAGGTLALAAASALRKTFTQLTIPAVVAFYPPTDLSIPADARTVPRPIRAFPVFLLNLFFGYYAPDKAMRTDPRISPGLASPAGFPPNVIIITCEGDNLSPEAAQLAEKLDDGKRRLIHEHLKATYHGYDMGSRQGSYEWGLREKTYGLVIDTLKDVLMH
ncbi:alpha/beta-hydrolase [Biscogniauxia mediterranea]|nr:alpha/beta-hydrolase [Biscogniauxia mediterranea]